MISVTLSEHRTVRNGVVRAYWMANYRVDGKHRQESLGVRSQGPGAVSKREAMKLLKAKSAEVNARMHARDGDGWRLGPWIDSYLRGANYSDSTTMDAEATRGLLVGFFGADRKIITINAGMASRFRESLATPYGPGVERRQGSGRNRSEQTIRKHMRICKAIFQRAVDDELIPRNPFAKQKSSVLPVDKDWAEIGPAEMTRILDACPSQAWRCLFALCRWGCLRQSEAVGLLWKHVDTVDWLTLTVAHTGRQTTKKRSREVPIVPALATALKAAWEAEPEGAVHVCRFSSHDVHRLETLAHDIIQRAHVPDYEKPFHTLRKCGVTDLCNDRRFSPAEVSEFTGHSPGVLMKHYYRASAARSAAALLRQPNGGDLAVTPPQNDQRPAGEQAASPESATS